MPAPLVVSGLAEGERDIAVFDHVLDLSSHCVCVAVLVSLVRAVAGADVSIMVKKHLLVRENRIKKYTTSTGQNTGRLKT